MLPLAHSSFAPPLRRGLFKGSTVINKTGCKLKKVNVRLWEADVDYLKEHFGDNYNAQVRRIVGNWIIRDRRTKTEEITEEMMP